MAPAIVACMFLSGQQAKNWRESALFFERELAVEPNDPWFQNNLGVVLELAGDHLGALHHLEAALKIWPGQLNPHLTLKEIYSSQGDYEEARESMMGGISARETMGMP